MREFLWKMLPAMVAMLLVVGASSALADLGAEDIPEVEVACEIVGKHQAVTVVCTTTPLTHQCRVREMSSETSPALPGNGARSTTKLFCPNRLSTAMLETDLIRTVAPGCRWTVPTTINNRIALACIDSPGSRNRKLGRFEIPAFG